LEDKESAPVKKAENTTVGIRHDDHVAPSIKKLALTSPISGGSSIGMVLSRIQAKDFLNMYIFVFIYIYIHIYGHRLRILYKKGKFRTVAMLA
jgi:hypothetical protein